MDRIITMRVVTMPFPEGVNGACLPDGKGGFIIAISETAPDQEGTFLHECRHIWRNDVESERPVQQIEQRNTA